MQKVSIIDLRLCHEYTSGTVKLNTIFIYTHFIIVDTNSTRSRWSLRRLRYKSTHRVRDHVTKGSWLYGRKLLIVRNHFDRFGGHRYCGSGDNMFLIYHVTSRDHECKRLWDVWLNELKFFVVIDILARSSGRSPCVCSDTTAKIFYVTLTESDQRIWWLCGREILIVYPHPVKILCS